MFPSHLSLPFPLPDTFPSSLSMLFPSHSLNTVMQSSFPPHTPTHSHTQFQQTPQVTCNTQSRVNLFLHSLHSFHCFYTTQRSLTWLKEGNTVKSETQWEILTLIDTTRENKQHLVFIYQGITVQHPSINRRSGFFLYLIESLQLCQWTHVITRRQVSTWPARPVATDQLRQWRTCSPQEE